MPLRFGAADAQGQPQAENTTIVRRPLLRPGLTALATLWLCTLCGCAEKVLQLDGSAAEPGIVFTAENVAPILQQFAPAAVRLHPLSRWDALAAEPTLLCHIELLDDNGDSIKWPTMVEVAVRPASGGLMGAAGAIASALGGNNGSVRFRFVAVDSASAATQFDPVTRSYLARLSGLPPWAAGRPATSVSIRAVSPVPPASSISLETDGEIPASNSPR